MFIWLLGSVLATFAAVSCLSAKIRDKDDYVNAFIGGSLSGSLFGVVGTEDDLCVINYHLIIICGQTS